MYILPFTSTIKMYTRTINAKTFKSEQVSECNCCFGVHGVTLLCTFIGSSNLDFVSFAVECEIKIHNFFIIIIPCLAIKY